MGIRKYYFIACIGLIVNVIYWSVEAFEYGLGGLRDDFWAAPTEHVVIIALIPIFALVGLLFDKVEKTNERLLVEVTERKKAEKEITRRSDLLLTLNKLLQLPLGDVSLTEMLEAVIDLTVSVPWLALESKGAIFLREGPDTLALKAERGLHESLVNQCAKVPFGQCLCGRAAQEGEIVFAKEIDHRHDTKYDGIEPHGHYCVPILSGGDVLGVITLYVKEGHLRNEKEEEFLIAITTVLAGIIQRKKAEDAIKKYSADLEEANNMKDLFIDIMRHDLLNPIGSIRNFADILGDDISDPVQKEVVDGIVGTSTKLIDMINSASQFSKLKEMEEIECQALDLGAILDDVYNDLRPQIKNAEIGVSFLPKGKYPVVVNPLVHDVFFNIISNIVKYAATGRKIELDIQGEDETWLVSIKDWGEGIPDKDKEKLFTRFERLGKEGVKGSGLGLAIAKRIVDLHNGRIWVEDNPEGGSVFFVSLPKAG